MQHLSDWELHQTVGGCWITFHIIHQIYRMMKISILIDRLFVEKGA